MARRGARALADRHRLAREQRLVDEQVRRLDEDRVGCHAVTLADDHEIPAHDLAMDLDGAILFITSDGYVKAYWGF